MDKILIIDDSALQARFLQSILDTEYEVRTCQTGIEGYREAKTGEYSLILLDLIMADMDGFTLLKMLKKSEQIKEIPVILITSMSDIQHEERGLMMGAVDYVTKPFSPIIIKARIKNHIQLYHYQQKYKSQARVDGLTGVANRRYYESESVVKWQEATRLGLTLSICMLDIDKFKVYNDTFGHQAGDEVIGMVARTVAGYLQRGTDFFARYGGEEFVGLFLGEQAKQIYEHMRKVRQAVEDLHIKHNSPVSEWVTISVGGVTCRPERGEEYERYLKVADGMLYEAKEKGRNRVIWYNGEGGEKWEEKGREVKE